MFSQLVRRAKLPALTLCDDVRMRQKRNSRHAMLIYKGVFARPTKFTNLFGVNILRKISL